MLIIICFFLGHWFLSLFFHSFFLHRFCSHKMYNVSKNWERFFYVTTWIAQGSSFLVPRAYGVMHRMHHTYSDTDKDPHSPHFFADVFGMMKGTILIFRSFLKGTNLPDPEFTKEYLPVWDKLDRIGDHMVTRILFGLAYVFIYVMFAPSAWWFLLLPIHIMMGPIQGAIVNWCGHKYGYSNYDNGDRSKNSSPFGFLLLGELFQNNHHYAKTDANFAKKWFEFDPTYFVMRGMHAIGIIKIIPVALSQPAEEPVQ